MFVLYITLCICVSGWFRGHCLGFVWLLEDSCCKADWIAFYVTCIHCLHPYQEKSLVAFDEDVLVDRQLISAAGGIRISLTPSRPSSKRSSTVVGNAPSSRPWTCIPAPNLSGAMTTRLSGRPSASSKSSLAPASLFVVDQQLLFGGSWTPLRCHLQRCNPSLALCVFPLQSNFRTTKMLSSNGINMISQVLWFCFWSKNIKIY